MFYNAQKYKIEFVVPCSEYEYCNLNEKLKKYEIRHEIDKLALKNAVSKIIDNCKYCPNIPGSKDCKNSDCEMAMSKYFRKEALNALKLKRESRLIS